MNTKIFDREKIPQDAQNVKKDEIKSAVEKAGKFLELFKFDEWMVSAATENEDGRFHKLCKMLDAMFTARRDFFDDFGNEKVEIDEDISYEEIKEIFPKIHKMFREKGQISKTDMMFNKNIRNCMSSIRINGDAVSSSEDCDVCKAYLICKMNEDAVKKKWSEVLVPYGIPEYEEAEEDMIRQIYDLTEIAFDYGENRAQLVKALGQLGIEWKRFFGIDRYDTRKKILEKLIEGSDKLKLLIEEKEEKGGDA